MELTSKQRAQLRGLASQMDTIVIVGKDGIGDNKWYASFKSAKGSKFSTKGDVWKLDMLYSIDYVNPETE